MSEPGFFDAYYATLVPLTNSANLLDLMARLHEAGLVDALRVPCGLPTISDRLNLSPAAAGALIDALVLHQVVQPDGDQYVLTPAWMTLTGDRALISLGTLLAGRQASGHVLRHLGVRDYWDLPAEDRLALARAVSLDPYADALVEDYRARMVDDPVGAAMLEGGRLLELGCGVAGRTLLTLRAAPELQAVGVELSADLAAEAARRAQDLGLADRFTVVCGDAATFVSPEPFDFGFWSQFFFPDRARGDALRTMHACLRPGAVLRAPVAESQAAVGSPDVARQDAVHNAMFRAWGIPARTPEDLESEVAAAGFVDITFAAGEAGPTLVARRP